MSALDYLGIVLLLVIVALLIPQTRRMIFNKMLSVVRERAQKEAQEIERQRRTTHLRQKYLRITQPIRDRTVDIMMIVGTKEDGGYVLMKAGTTTDSVPVVIDRELPNLVEIDVFDSGNPAHMETGARTMRRFAAQLKQRALTEGWTDLDSIPGSVHQDVMFFVRTYRGHADVITRALESTKLGIRSPGGHATEMVEQLLTPRNRTPSQGQPVHASAIFSMTAAESEKET